MIIKAFQIANPREKIAYIYNEEKAGLIYSNMGFKDIERVTNLFKNHSKLHTTQKKAVHIIVGFPPEDILTNEKIRAIAYELVNRVGSKDCPWALVTHNGLQHFHLLVSRINWQGKLINRDWHVVRALMPMARGLERDFNLLPNDITRKRGDYRTSNEIFGYPKILTHNEYIRIHASIALEKSYDMLDYKMYCEEKGIFFMKSHNYDGHVYNFKSHYVSASDLGDKYKLDELIKYIEDRPKRVSKMLLGIIDEEITADKVRNSHWNELSIKMRERGIQMELIREEGKNILKLNFENNDYYFRINQEIMRLLIQMFQTFQRENYYSENVREENASYVNTINLGNERKNYNNDYSGSQFQDPSKKKGWGM